jgi:hypothetical protein
MEYFAINDVWLAGNGNRYKVINIDSKGNACLKCLDSRKKIFHRRISDTAGWIKIENWNNNLD